MFALPTHPGAIANFDISIIPNLVLLCHVRSECHRVARFAPEIEPTHPVQVTVISALSHAMEDQVLAGNGEDCPLVIASFQRERFYRQEAQKLGARSW